jgi:integrase
LGRQIERLVNQRVAGEQPDAQLSKWLERIPVKLRDRFVKVGLLDASRAAAGKPLSEHLADFEQSLLAKGDTAKQAKQVVSRVRRIVDGCRLYTWTDIKASKVQQYLYQLRRGKDGISKQTFNHYLKAIKQFANWMVEDQRASQSPLTHLKGLKIDRKTDRRHNRRALEVEEVRRLLETTRAAETRFGMTGPERAWLYRLAIETGLRADELRTLTVGSFDFGKQIITVEAAYSKRRRQDVLPLRPETAAGLKELFTTKLPSAQAFRVPVKAYAMLKADLAEAGIPYVDDAGRYADFHSLRHTTASWLAAAGVHPSVAQSIMRHSDIRLTMHAYTHVPTGQETKAIAKLPDLSAPSKKERSERKKAT